MSEKLLVVNDLLLLKKVDKKLSEFDQTSTSNSAIFDVVEAGPDANVNDIAGRERTLKAGDRVLLKPGEYGRLEYGGEVYHHAYASDVLAIIDPTGKGEK